MPAVSGPVQLFDIPALAKKLIGAPLYSTVPLRPDAPGHDVKLLREKSIKFDLYCPACKQSATWDSDGGHGLDGTGEVEFALGSQAAIRASGFSLTFECTRAHHKLALFLQPADDEKAGPGLIKIGQYPSMTDFQLGDLADFEAAMSKPQRKEFVRAINTGAHGFNVAACVYYRRVFEDVLDEARAAHMKQHELADWPDYQKAFTPDKIKLLASQLPKFMVDHPEIYSILSKGVHELTEEECGQVLPLLRSSIEMIMTKRKEAADAAKREALIKQQLAQFQSREI